MLTSWKANQTHTGPFPTCAGSVQSGSRNEPTVIRDQSYLLEQMCPRKKMPDLSLIGTIPLVQRKAKFKEAKSIRRHVGPGKGTNAGEWVTPGAVSTGWLPLKH